MCMQKQEEGHAGFTYTYLYEHKFVTFEQQFHVWKEAQFLLLGMLVTYQMGGSASFVEAAGYLVKACRLRMHMLWVTR